MARIAWTDIPENKRVVIALTYIVWVWDTTSKKLLATLWLDESIRVKDLSEVELDKIRNELQKIPTEVEVRRAQALDIQRIQQAWTYRGYRHRVWLPCRWQNTKTNAKTSKKRGWKKRGPVVRQK